MDLFFNPTATSEEKEETLQTVRKYLEKGYGNEASVKLYGDTGHKYEKYMTVASFEGPIVTADTMAELFPLNRDKIKILDVAAGTGLAGLEMFKLGFKQMDALDPAQGMLDVAKAKNVYGRLICDYIGDNRLDIPDNTYDAITICGGMGENQIPCSGFMEMLRIIKPGSVLVNVTRVEHFQLCENYKKHLEPMFVKLEEDGRWDLEIKRTFPNFIFGKQGIVLVHRIH